MQNRIEVARLAVAVRGRYGQAMSGEVTTAHEAAANARQIEIYRAMLPERRMEIALRMRTGMRELLAAGFRDRFPAWTEQDVRKAVAKRILHARTD